MVPRRTPLTICAAQPACTAGDLAGNVRKHADVVRAAASRVVVFPELSLTGYEIDAAVPVGPGSEALTPLIAACRLTGSIALVGAPVREHGRQFIAMLAVDGSGAGVVYRKMFPGSDEAHRFHAGPAPTVYQVDGWRLGLGICRDTSVPAHLEMLSELGVDTYLAGLVMHPHETPEQDARAARIARVLHVPVAFASFAGPAGSGYPDTAGHSGIWAADGTTVSQATRRPGDTASATLHP